jgi:hypothetical protein
MKERSPQEEQAHGSTASPKVSLKLFGDKAGKAIGLFLGVKPGSSDTHAPMSRPPAQSAARIMRTIRCKCDLIYSPHRGISGYSAALRG